MFMVATRLADVIERSMRDYRKSLGILRRGFLSCGNWYRMFEL